MIDEEKKQLFNSCVVLFLDLYNELIERVRDSTISDNIFNLVEIKEIEKGGTESIKHHLRLLHFQGKFNDVIDHYLIVDSDIDAIIFRIIEISKSSSSIPNHVLIKLESKEIYIKSFLQKEVQAKIKTNLFLINSVKEVELIIIELILISKAKLEAMALSKMI